MKKFLVSVVVLMVGLMFAGVGQASEKATKEECVAKCKAAARSVKDEGLKSTLAKINDPKGPFVWKNSYVFCLDLNKACNIAHPIKPKLIGKNLMAAKDSNGTMFFAEFINIAKNKGEGWVKYMWPKVGEKKPSPKITYVYKVPGHDIAMCAGIYE